MNTRIVQLMEAEQLSATKFADLLGVQRSSISHILSGRNKPSLDFVEKILRQFPAINPDWLILGKKTMYREPYSPTLFPTTEANNEPIVLPKTNTPTRTIEEIPTTEAPIAPVTPPTITANTNGQKQVQRVMIFYADNTFDTYTPAQ